MLTDIDKSSVDRGSPLPNTHDVVPPESFPARSTNSVNYISAASNSGILSAAKNGQLTIIQSAVVYTQSAAYPSGGAGAYASQTVKVLTVAHGLPFIPIVVSFYYNGLYNVMPFIAYNSLGSAAQWTRFRVSVDATNIYFYADMMSYGDSSGIFTGSAPIKYYLMYQTSN